MLKALREVSIVGQDQKAFRIVVETSDGKHPLRDPAEEIRYNRPSLRIVKRRHIALWFMEQNIDPLCITRDQSAIHADFVPVGVRLCSRFHHHGLVDGNPAFGDHLFRRATGRDARAREDFLYAFFHSPIPAAPVNLSVPEASAIRKDPSS